MAAVARCSECGKPLLYEDGSPKPAGTKTDSIACRSKRARRLKREEKARNAKKGQRPAHVQEISDALKSGDALHEAAVDEFRPLVREAMTESVLQGINRMIGMTAKSIDALEADLNSQDETIRQRAYTLQLKYTMGNPSVAPPSTTAAPAGLTVQFNLPRPGDDPAASISDAATTEAEELRVCMDCGTEKPDSQFVGASERCQACFDDMGNMLKGRFGDAYGS